LAEVDQRAHSAPALPPSGPQNHPSVAAEQGDGSTQALDFDSIQKLADADRVGTPQVGPDPEALWQRGAAAWEAQDWDEALRCYHQVVELQPGRTEAARAVADIYYGLGQVDEAEQWYQRVLQDWPDDSYSRQALAQIAAYRRS